MNTSSPLVHVLISGGFSGAYERLVPEFTRTTGIEVTTGSGASQGKGPHTIGAQLARGVAVRAGGAKPDVSSVDAVRQVLLKAKIIAIPASTSGIWLKEDLFPRLGIADKLDARMTPRGSDAAAMVAAGGADLAVMPVSEILVAPGVDFAGAFPAEIQMIQVFAAAAVANSPALEAAKRLIALLSSPQAVDAIRGSGMEPMTRG